MGFVINYRHGCRLVRLCKAGAHQLTDPEEGQNRAFMRGYCGAKSFIYINNNIQNRAQMRSYFGLDRFVSLTRVPKAVQICTGARLQHQH